MSRSRSPDMSEIIHAKLRGVIGAMAMTGLRYGVLFGFVLNEMRERPRE
jgi:hypothetical protein